METLYLMIIFVVVYDFCDLGSALSVSKNGTTVSNSSEEVLETQYATCRISTEELDANAEATVTRVLTGVCNAEAVEKRFVNLERTIKRQFEDIKQMLNKMVRLTQKTVTHIVNPRQEEIDRYNNTVNTVNTATGVGRTLVSYIGVKDFDQKVSHWDLGMFERSSTIYIDKRRYAMYVKITPKYMNGETMYVNIGVGVTRGMDDGALDWPFPLKYQVEILDHSPPEFRRDFTSSIIDPMISGSLTNWARPSSFGNADNPDYVSIGVPTSVIFGDTQPQIRFPYNPTTTKYIWQGDLILKITVYL